MLINDRKRDRLIIYVLRNNLKTGNKKGEARHPDEGVAYRDTPLSRTPSFQHDEHLATPHCGCIRLWRGTAGVCKHREPSPRAPFAVCADGAPNQPDGQDQSTMAGEGINPR